MKDLEAELSAQVEFLEKEIGERNNKIKVLTDKIADMQKNDFMINEQLASLRRDFEVSSKKLLEFELRQKKQLVSGKIEEQPLSVDSREVAIAKRPGAPAVRPGSRSNPLAPINERGLALPIKAE